MVHPQHTSSGHERVSVTQLRRAKPLKLFGGRSSGEVCDFCRVPITPNDPEYEVDAELDGARITLHSHVTCYDSWRAADPDQDAPATPSTRDKAA